MKPSVIARAVACALPLLAPRMHAQTWRRSAASLGTTTRVLIIGARPEDEDNALIAWLSLGHNVETAYLSVTRGESSVNVAGSERQSALAVVRTAELLAERQRDGAHQFFTRAYDFGPTSLDSVVDTMWPHDSLVHDVVSIVRAYRPHVIIAMTSADTSEHDATRRVAARLAREAFDLAPDTARMPITAASRLPAWAPLKLFTSVDSARTGAPGILRIDVGAFDRDAGRTYAELGAEIRRLQRTQPSPPAPILGRVVHMFHADTSRTGGGEEADASNLFAGIDTSWNRFNAPELNRARPSLDSLGATLAFLRDGARTASPDSLAAAFARAAKYALDVRLALPCSDVGGVPSCPRGVGDLAVAMESMHRRAARSFVDASGIVIDGTVARDLVASGDSVPVAARVYNGSARPMWVRKLTATSRTAWSPLLRDSVAVPPDSGAVWNGFVRVGGISLHWWQVNGLQGMTALHAFGTSRGNSVVQQMINGEDHIPQSGIEAIIGFAGVDVPLVQSPLVYRAPGIVRGDERHPLAGVAAVSVLLERTAEFERSGLPIDRLFRVYVASAHTKPDTLSVEIQLPKGLRADSSMREVVVPPMGARNVFFRLRGKLPVGPDSVHALARMVHAAPPRPASPGNSGTRPVAPMPFDLRPFTFGSITHEYPHIPSQQFVRSAGERVEAVDVKIPPRLHVAYVKGSEDVQTPLGQLQVNVQALEPSLLSVVDLSYFSTVLIGADALANDALAGAVPSLIDFMKKGGALVVMSGGEEISRSGLLPYAMVFDTLPHRIRNPETPVRVNDATSMLLRWPNAISDSDFKEWSVERARGIPIGFDSHYRTPLAVGDPAQSPNLATLLAAPVGKGMIIYSALSLDREVIAITPGAARLFVNLLSAGLKAGSTRIP